MEVSMLSRLCVSLLLSAGLPSGCHACGITGSKVNCSSRGLTSLPGNLPHDMTELNFSDNELTHLNSKVFFDFTLLEKIDLSNNIIEVVAMDAFDGLLNLRTLNLQRNRITNLQSKSFIDLEWVTMIDLSSNPLGDFPAEVFEDCLRLSRLELRNTGLDERDFANIGILPKLDHLDLSANTFSYLPYLMLSQFGSLSQLWLNNCSIQTIDANAFVGLQALRTLKLVGNKIANLNRETFQTLQLAYLELAGNPLECDCGMSHFKDWVDLGVYVGSQSCTAPGGKVYNIITDDLTGFCATWGPPVTDPCGGAGSLSLTLVEVTHDQVQIQWTSMSIPNSLVLSANLRIYAEKNTETWEMIAVSRNVYTFKRLKEGSDYILCMIQRQCEVYACLDFATMNNPRADAVREPDCISVEITAGIATAAAFLTLLLTMLAVYLVLRGVCCCSANNKALSPAEPIRRTQPVLPMQASVSYIPGHPQSKHRHPSNNADTYDAIGMEDLITEKDHSRLFSNHQKERARKANDPLPPIHDTPIAVGIPRHDCGVRVIQGIESSYLHPGEQEVDSPLAHGINPSIGITGRKLGTYLQPTDVALRQQQPSTKQTPDLTSRHTMANALSTSDPYHVYQEANDDDIVTDPAALRERRRSDGQTLDRPFHKLTLEDIKQQIESGASTGKVTRFRRPAAMKGGAQSCSTPNILQQVSELPRDSRLLHSNF